MEGGGWGVEGKRLGGIRWFEAEKKENGKGRGSETERKWLNKREMAKKSDGWRK